MTIIETFIQLRDDIKTWVTNNLVALNNKVENINNFSGDYNDLTNKPEILEDSSDSFIIADNAGNVILDVDAEGLKTTAVSINGEDVAQKIKSVNDMLDAHADNKQIHVTATEKATWNAKSDFSGDYNDLTNKPEVLDDGSNSFIVADSSGNIILDVDADGLKTTAVSINGEDVAEKFNTTNEKIDNHIDNKVVHITASERSTWNAKSDFSGNYNDLIDTPNILDDDSDNFAIADKSGNIVFKVDKNGVSTTAVSVNGENIIDIIDNVDEKLDNHIEDKVAHITNIERTKWNEKSDFSGDYNDLTNKPNLIDDNSDNLTIADKAGNVIAKVDENGLTTTTITAESVVVNGTEITTYVDTKVANLVDSSPETLNTLNELAAALGDDPNFATTVAEQIGLKADEAALKGHINDTLNPHKVTKAQVGLGNVDNTSDVNKPVSTAQATAIADAKKAGTDAQAKADSAYNLADTKASQTDFNNHVNDKVVHITDAERQNWNDKSEFSGDYKDLTNVPNITEDESGDLAIVDPDNNVIFRTNGNGVETTTLTAKQIVIAGTDVKETLTEHKTLIDNKVNVEDIKDMVTAPGGASLTLEDVFGEGPYIIEITSEEEADGTIVETDPTVPAWAKEPNKPTYTAEEVGAAAAIHASQHKAGGADPITPADIGALDNTSSGQAIPNNSDLNDYITPGVYKSSDSNVSATIANAPFTNVGFKMIVTKHYTTTGILQIVLPTSETSPFMYRYYEGGKWYGWRTVYDTNVKPTAADVGAVPLDGSKPMTGVLKSPNGVYINKLGLEEWGAGEAFMKLNDRNGNGSRYIGIMDKTKADSMAGALNFVESIDGAYNVKTILHTGNKNLITPADIGAAPSSYGSYYGTCSTAAGTAAKTVACTGFTLVTGASIKVRFTVTNTAAVADLTLNVNSTGAKGIKYRNANLGSAGYLAANRTYEFVYDGTYYQLIGDLDTNTINYGIVQCSTAAATAAKVGSTNKYDPSNRYIIVVMNYANSAASALTLNINSNGAKPIYINGSASSSSNYTLPAGTYIVYYNGTNYYFRTDGYLNANVTGTASGLSTTLSTSKGGTGYTSITDTTYTTARYRASALVSTATDPTTNGVINWVYE